MGKVGRRTLAGGAALVPAAGLIGAARAETPAESALDRIRRTKTLRIAALPGELPYFQKNLATGAWGGAAIEMADSIAKLLGAKLDYVEATYGTSVLDLQSDKVYLAFALNPTPERTLAVRFAHPMLIHPFGCLARPGLAPKTWADIDKPEIRIAFDIGSLHETVAKRFAPKAQHVGFPNRDQALLALQSGRADVDVLAALLGLSAVAKNPALGRWYLLGQPTVALPSSLAVQYEPDTRFVDVLNAWLDFNRGIGQLREWIIGGLELEGVKREQIPSELTF
ncbi:MAG: transporter substrate-binding domain-containing protein [Acetobacteraceae bacterium]|nr:transporter substrate-binding domain-containing protein [Acetobacteraceae bacterium]